MAQTQARKSFEGSNSSRGKTARGNPTEKEPAANTRPKLVPHSKRATRSNKKDVTKAAMVSDFDICDSDDFDKVRPSRTSTSRPKD
jgi:hypothetical protein